MSDYAKRFHPRHDPINTTNYYYLEGKDLEDGAILRLSADVSGIEFIGVPTFKLELIEELPGSVFYGQLFIIRPYSSMLSETAYRTLMGRIKNAEDFTRLSNGLESKIKEFYENLKGPEKSE